LVLSLLAVSATAATVVYKWTDSVGVVHYSDQPRAGAEKVVISPGPAHGAAAPAAPVADVPATRAAAAPTRVVIQSPASEQVFFGAETIPVRLSVEPPLRPTQTVTWQLNGNAVDADQSQTEITFQSLDRGTYVVTATVADTASGESQSAPGVTFYVRQPSELAPLHKKH
ncbi:MAG: DUF4124 domain-containing protein, partial [Pseudomonadota bacterium]|nr:DUF4124 domain-containing protein [Pseudomonadota bacterium]